MSRLARSRYPRADCTASIAIPAEEARVTITLNA